MANALASRYSRHRGLTDPAAARAASPAPPNASAWRAASRSPRASATNASAAAAERNGHPEPDDGGGQRQQRELRGEHHAERALAAHEPVDRVVGELVAGGVLFHRRAPELEHAAVGEGRPSARARAAAWRRT
jgi:hypothetical protein